MEDFNFYPDKPELEEKKASGGFAVTIFSVILFAATFLLFFSEEYQFLLNLLIVLTFHELGHFLLMKRFNYTNVRMLFVPLMGAFVQGSKDEYSQRESLLVVGAGPFPGVIVGFALLVFAIIYQQPWMLELSFLFLLLNLINLIPIDPLDGGQLLKLFIPIKFDLFLLIFSFLSSLILIAIGLWLETWVLVVIGFFMGVRVNSLQRNYHIHKDLKRMKVNYFVNYKKLSNKDYLTIKNVLIDYSSTLKKLVEMMPAEEIDSMMAEQVNSVLVSPVVNDASKVFKFFVLFFWFISLLSCCYLGYVLIFESSISEFIN
jgi:Zn-dependent protease